jgi:hypothetical protein
VLILLTGFDQSHRLRVDAQSTEQDLRTRIQNRAGTAAVAPAFFYAFQNIEENVRH